MFLRSLSIPALYILYKFIVNCQFKLILTAFFSASRLLHVSKYCCSGQLGINMIFYMILFEMGV